MHAIEDLAGFAADHPRGALPVAVRDAIRDLVTDLLGAAAAGLHTPLATAARGAAPALHGPGPCGVWFTGMGLSVAGAAMANAAAASALDIDDGHRGAAGHPGAGVIPAALAVGQALGSDDAAILDAIALGYDVALRVGASRPTGSFDTYASGRWVGYGVAVAAGRLLELDAGAMAHAMAIAGAEGPISFATGSSAYQGSTVKEAIPPAVVAGLTGAFRARAGATGPLDLLDRDDRFARVRLTGGLGADWALLHCYLKPYACCRYMHAAVDAIAALRQPGRPVVSLAIETFPQGLRLSNARRPATLEAGQYSYYFSCALAALHGVTALQPVDPAWLHDADVLALAERITLSAHADFADAFPVGTPCRVIVDHGDGPRALTVHHPLGDVANPMSRAQITDKFRRIAAANVPAARRDAVLAALDGLTADGFAPLLAALKHDTTDTMTQQGGTTDALLV
ncbi:MmgE/PrpD family protein [Rhodobaculum claviforme]|uniref:MmgE/PrpD family protein n=2 Tax=Rhodobaculum claviforme TaxID=1549854 RepID=A0A934THQ8_9RHOB|nr:MmgE/PrpD family protein [Rhodobaculum claviforme]